MSKLRVVNFGPINEGLIGDAFIEIKKVTTFIGNQATGKSSVAKLYSTIAWIEKSLFRQQLKINDVVKYNRFINRHCDYQGIKNYFKKNTIIEYLGSFIDLVHENGKTHIYEKQNSEAFLLPKIMYVPAERNFLSLVDSPDKLKYLPSPLYTFLDEFERSKSEISKPIQLPLNNISFEFQRQNKISYIRGEDFRLRLSEASSGIQSMLPLFLVSKNIAESINSKSESNIKSLTLKELKKIRKEVDAILKMGDISDEIKSVLLERLSNTYKNRCFINIVEEIEQNLFPESQRKLVNELLKVNNLNNGNRLILTTHSPYIINYLTLAIKGFQISKNIPSNNNSPKSRIEKIVPIESLISGEDVSIYEFQEDGIIRKLKNYEGIPSDENFLNKYLYETNILFDDLLEVEQSL